MIEHLKGLWSSTSFRLTLNYSALAIFTTLFLIGFFYVQVFGALRSEYIRQVNSTMQRLTIAYERGGREGVLRITELIFSDRVDSGQEVFLFLDEQHHVLAGNLKEIPDISAIKNNQIQKLPIKYGRKWTEGQVRVQHLAGGETLIVGQELGRLVDLNALIARVLLASLILAFLLVLLGAYVFSNELKLRVGKIRHLTDQVGKGNISKRIQSPNKDVFGLIHADINIMLDKIENLMKGVRHVSDTVAHNIRTPLTRVIGRLREVQHAPHMPEHVQQEHQAAINELENLSVLLGKLLQISELNAGVSRKQFKACDLNQIAEDVYELYAPFAEEKGLQLQLHLEQSVYIQGDKDLLASALANVVENALKFARTTVCMQIRYLPSGQVCLTVSDDGPGVAEHEYPNLGQYFYRLDSQNSGSGLGLTSVTSIVQLHGGQMRFSNNQPGLRVDIVLP